jgi:hypothetical protein
MIAARTDHDRASELHGMRRPLSHVACVGVLGPALSHKVTPVLENRSGQHYARSPFPMRSGETEREHTGNR